ncbi:MAG: hypothetical protein KJ017_02285 [Alphaproteobacteria bacterium]|nr:hypothetical protein [Alphaproteobacteria bacterium]
MIAKAMILKQSPPRTVRTALARTLTLIMGFLCCWTPLTAPLLTGWLNRYMRHCAVKVWVKKSNLNDKDAFYQDEENSSLKLWPKWLYAKTTSQPTDNTLTRALRKIKSVVGCLWRNYQNGLMTIFNTWALTLPLGFCWLWMWWAGWNNTFARAYEEEGLAQSVLFLSMLAFCVLMLYLPLAQARQAIQGRWQSFFDIRAIRVVARHIRFRLFLLALSYALIGGIILIGSKAILANFNQIYAVDIHDVKTMEQKLFLHFLGMISIFYLGLLLVKRMNARVYAIGVIKALQSGALKPEHLTPYERKILIDRLGYKQAAPKKRGPRWRGALTWPLKKIGVVLLVLATLGVWGGLVSTLYFAQFMNHSYPDWLNLPLIQMPYIRVPEINPG